MKNLFSQIKTRIFKNKLVTLIVAGAFCVVVIVLIILISGSSARKKVPVVLGSGLVLEDEYWTQNDKGYPYYDKEGSQNIYGIDISEWVEDIDFRKVRSYGMDYVILRVGYRGYETGKFVLDNNLADYLKQASAAGFQIGAYFVSQAIDEQEAVEEAEFVLEHVKGYPIDMPIYIDLEEVYDTARTDHLTREDYTRIVKAFIDCLKSNGYHGGVYANESWLLEKLDLSQLEEYDLWLAKYTDTPGETLAINMWQFSNEGLVDGCDMWVDLNVRVVPDEEPDAESDTDTDTQASQETEQGET